MNFKKELVLSIKILVFICVASISSQSIARAVKNTEMDGCLYDGKRLSPGAMADTDTLRQSVPDDFSGHVICYHIQTKMKKKSFHLVAGMKTGGFKDYDAQTGNIAKEGEYKNDKYHGVILQYDHRNGKLQRELHYENGQLSGVQRNYNSETGLLQRVFWMGDAKSSEKTSIQFTKEGHPSSIKCGAYSVLPEDVIWCGRNGARGQISLYNSKGRITKIKEYLNGQKDGRHVRLNDDGSVNRLTIYKQGSKISSELFENGKLLNTFEFNNGKEQTGIALSFFPNTKQKESETIWQKGYKQSEKLYFLNGHLKKEITHNLNETANIRRYNDEGGLVLTGQYRKVFYGSRSYFTPDGTVIRYYHNGSIFEESKYKDGSRHGGTSYFNEKGMLSRKEEYVEGVMMKSIDYSAKGNVIRTMEYYADGSIKKETGEEIEI